MQGVRLFDVRERLEKIYLDDRRFGSGRKFSERLAATVGAEGILLDIGCGEATLRAQLDPRARYVGVDRYLGEKSGEYSGWDMRPSVVADAHCLPFKDDTFTVVAMMHVLEHISEPHVVFQEVWRLLIPGGHLFVDVPFLYQLHHQPNDYFRYTPYSLRHLAESSGFEVQEILPSGGYFRFIAYALRRAPSSVSTRGVYGLIIRAFIGWPLAAIGAVLGSAQYLLDICDNNQEMVCGYHVIMRKPVK